MRCGTIWDAQSADLGLRARQHPDAPPCTRRRDRGSGSRCARASAPTPAWKTTTGRPDVAVAILDTGIRWDSAELRQQVHLNDGELPAVQDKDGNGVVSVDDFVGLVDPALGPNGDKDARSTGRTSCCATPTARTTTATATSTTSPGWDFFDGDNDPFDASSYSSASNHGTGRASDAAERGNDGAGEIGMCPRCTDHPGPRVGHVRRVGRPTTPWARRTPPTPGGRSSRSPSGALSNSPSAQAATRYAYDKGVTLAVVSSDLNTANHNYPTNYTETIEVNGVVADTYGLGAAEANEFGLPAGLPSASARRRRSARTSATAG